MKTKHIFSAIVSLMFALMSFGASATEIYRPALIAVSPILYDVVEQFETEQGKDFGSLEELELVMNTEAFRDRFRDAINVFCDNQSNSGNYLCQLRETRGWAQ